MKFKYYVIGVICFIGMIVFSFFMTNLDLKFKEYFLPKYENMNRKVFEETQSYNYGMSQDLARYYEQYMKAESTNDKEVIGNVIKMRFSDFNSENLRNEKLKIFLTTVRGY